ncbi:MAG: efflux RND transporter periplasmic adaptor subunit [Negativicutes bacterium]|nr:efflux RND transporter periplasmic adaptor subunit [Negativicutes bacterium]
MLFQKGPLGPPKVSVAKVQKENLKPSVFGIGTVEARLSYAIGPTQAGRVLTALADQGDRVQVGQVLGDIDPVDIDQRLQSASAAASRAQNAVMVSEAQVRDAVSRNALAQTSAKRYTDLFAAQAISRELTDAKQNEATSAQASLDAARATLAAAQEDFSRASFDRNAVMSQRTNLQLISPSNGIIVSRDAEPGTTVVAGQSVFHLIDPQTLWVRTRIDQSRFYGIMVGQTASIVLRSRPDAPIPGKVVRLEVQGDNVTEERFVNVMFNEVPNIIPLGELAEVTIDLPPVSDALVVPAAAVKRLNKQYGVWIAENGLIHFQPVTVGVQTLDGKVQILEGLKQGESIVTHSPKQLTEGLRVRVEPVL